MEGDIIFGNVVISNNDEGNNTRNDNKQFTMACSDALGSWPSERSSTADAVCLNIAAIEKCHFSTGSAVHLMNTVIMTLVLNTFFDPTVRLVMMHFHWWVFLKRVAVASIPALWKKVVREIMDRWDHGLLIQTFAYLLIIHGHVSHIKAFGFFLHRPFFFLRLPTYMAIFLEPEPLQFILAVFNRQKI